MSFNVAMLKQMQAEGLDFDAAIRVLEAGEKKADPTNAVRQARYRAKAKEGKESNAVTVTPVTPPNDIDILTPREVSEPSGSSPQPRPWALPIGVSLQVWTDLMTNRKRKRLPNTPTAWVKFQTDLAEIAAQTGIPPPKVIEMCVAKGWGAIYDPTEDHGNGQRTSANRTSGQRMGGPRPDPTLELVRAAAAAQRQDGRDYGEARTALPSR
jgi:hypothetical protein